MTTHPNGVRRILDNAADRALTSADVGTDAT